MKYKVFLVGCTILLLFTFAQSQTSSTDGDIKLGDGVKDSIEKSKPKTDQNAKKVNEHLTYENFKLIQLGMIYEQVKEILGSEGKVTAKTKVDDYESKSYQWRDSEYKTISLRFRNGVLVSKSQVNLTGKKGVAEIDVEKFRLIQIGMSYEVLGGIIGSDGEMTSLARTGDSTLTSYVWKGSEIQRIRANFKNNELINKTESGLESKKNNLTIEKFNQIKLEMSYLQVEAIIGSEGNETASSKSGSYESKSYQWKGDKFARISTRFRNGKLVYKSQSSLTPSKGTATLTQAAFNKVNTGMSYEQVKAAIGSEGEMTRVSKIGNTTLKSYVWKGPKYERVFASFKDGKLTNKTQSNLK